MNLSECPYCNLPGLVTTINPTGAGLEVQGQCTICGYTCDSGFAPQEQTDDLPGEYMRALEQEAAR
ncbi:MAG: hypothetical protein IT317_13240 [Anaerolineales bacterium]|nr:hypothetical protein [Anaerolineales bacterium]